MIKPAVIGIAAVMGGGKTSLTNSLGRTLAHATTLHFDDFEDSTEDPPDWKKWSEDGADYNAWKVPGIIDQLERLVSGEAVGPCGEPFNYVVFDAPLGRAHHTLAGYIDHMVYIETPLDVAMARRLLRDGLNEDAEGQLRAYLRWGRQLYTNGTVKRTADLILDGTLPVEDLARQVVEAFGLHTLN